jgi:hypothetical protein
VKNSFHLAYYQPKFIIDQVLAECKYQNIPPKFTKKRINSALQNLYVHIEMDDPGPCEPAQPAAPQVEPQPEPPPPAAAPEPAPAHHAAPEGHD